MLDWLKKIVGGGPGQAEGPGDLTEEQYGWLSRDLHPLKKLGGGLKEKAAGFVATGVGGEVLEELASQERLGVSLRLRCCLNAYDRPGLDERPRLLKSFSPGQEKAALRLALVWEAASRDRRSLRMKDYGVPDWLEVFVQETTDSSPRGGTPQSGKVRLEILEEMLVAADLPRHLLLQTLLQLDPKDWSAQWTRTALYALPGWDQAILRHPEAVRQALARKEADRRAQTLELLVHAEAGPEPFALEIAEQAVSSSKRVREAAETLAKRMPAALRPALEERAVAGGAEERFQAVVLLGRLGLQESEPLLLRRLDEEKSDKVKAAIREALARREEDSAAAAGTEFEPPPAPAVDLDAPLPAGIREALQEISPAVYQREKKWHEQEPKYNRAPKAPDPGLVDAVVQHLQTGDWSRTRRRETTLDWNDEEVGRFLSVPGLRLVHAVRFLLLWGRLSSRHWLARWMREPLQRFYQAHPPGFDLRELAAVFGALGLQEEDVEEMLLGRTSWSPFEIAPEHTWPYFAGRQESLEAALAGSSSSSGSDEQRRNALEILALFPRLPKRLAPKVWEMALSGPKPKKEKLLAQACLDREPGRNGRLVAALGSPTGEARAAAAEWLGRIGDAAAVAPLKAALEAEKQEIAAGAMMFALERLGVPPAEIADLDGLLAQARKLAKKETPAGLSWFPFEALPAVRWKESGEPVEREVLRWIVLQSHKLGSPEPGPRLRYLASFFRPEDAEELGQLVLDAWISHDTLGHPSDEAHAYAEAQATQHLQMAKHYPEYYKDLTREEAHRMYYTAKLNEPRGSAIKEKGVLAVAGACCGGRAAASVERYLKTWYGLRVAHCRALLQTLAWVEHRSAIQVLLATSARFRTTSIRQEAERLVQVLAERKGWTVDQLADRTIPTAGFDESCELTLDYGGRTFTAKLGEDWSVVLVNEEGKTIKALPDARQGEDEETVKAAKKTLAAARKEIQAILRLQKDRLYEALCTQRSWSFEDWDDLLHRHPIVRRYCQRLVWGLWDGETLAATFRPLEDGSLTDAADEEVTAAPEATVRLAHSSLVSGEIAAAWRRHFADYQVQPLFEQFGEPWLLPEDQRKATSLAEFRGHLLEAFALRGRATKLGYSRSQAVDSGIFTSYEKPFPGLGLTAVIEFSGNMLPEENRTVALTGLSFQRTSYRPLPLGEIPPVLLSECRNDMASIAAQGAGYDPDWEKKTPW